MHQQLIYNYYISIYTVGLPQPQAVHASHSTFHLDNGNHHPIFISSSSLHKMANVNVPAVSDCSHTCICHFMFCLCCSAVKSGRWLGGCSMCNHCLFAHVQVCRLCLHTWTNIDYVPCYTQSCNCCKK